MHAQIHPQPLGSKDQNNFFLKVPCHVTYQIKGNGA